jgi:DNA-directed RNA polymerase subunit M/transcription elongation factor TFIIS
MSRLIRCPECQGSLRVREDQGDKKTRCPKCQAVFRVPAEEPAKAPAHDVVEEVADDTPIDEPAPKSKYAECPKCGALAAKRVKWTAWGSFYGPALLCHVRCQECGATYNGRSGRSNLIPAIAFVSLPLLVIGGIFYWVFTVLRARGQL